MMCVRGTTWKMVLVNTISLSRRLVFQLFVLGELETLGFGQYSTYDDIVVENQSSFCPRVLAGAPRSTISSVNFHLIASGHWI